MVDANVVGYLGFRVIAVIHCSLSFLLLGMCCTENQNCSYTAIGSGDDKRMG